MIDFPKGARLDDLLKLETTIPLDDLLATSLMNPLQEFFSRPKKGIRGEMVKLGFQLCAAREEHGHRESHCEALASALELLHAGSLVVDDIQDGSTLRRGARSMHELYGVPLALNVGNWLYFWPLKKIEELDLSADVRLRLYQECHGTLLRAHFGQAIDVGTPVTSLPQERVPQVCLATIELKTGALMSLAMKLGAILGDATESELRTIDRFGHQFGIALQMLDDVGNLASPKSGEKRFEDLRNARPGFVWCVAAELLSPAEFAVFCIHAGRLPESQSALLEMVDSTGLIEVATTKARNFLEHAVSTVITRLEARPAAIQHLRLLQKELTSAYE